MITAEVVALWWIATGAFIAAVEFDQREGFRAEWILLWPFAIAVGLVDRIIRHADGLRDALVLRATVIALATTVATLAIY